MRTAIEVRRFAFCVAAIVPIASQCARANELALVGFDLPSIVIAQRMSPESATFPTSGGKLIRVVVPVSTFLSSEFRGSVREYLVELESPQQTMRIVDFWPRREVYSDIEGTVQVENKSQVDSDFNLSLSAGFEPFVRGTAGGKTHNNTSTHESYQRKPQLQVVTSSGTIRRGHGVFFKFHSGPLPNSEGQHQIAFLAEVPADWRADVMQVTLSAVGSLNHGGRDTRELGNGRLWTSVYLEGDRFAAERARMFVKREQTLRRLATANHQRILEKSLPTIWHKVGAALDVVEPRIPADYLNRVLFGASGGYLDSGSQRLPVDMRVAVLDFWDARDELMRLAAGLPTGAGIASTRLTMSRVDH